MNRVSIIIPMRNEAAALPELITNLSALSPQPYEIICVDGESCDDSITLTKRAGLRTISSPKIGRSCQINFGVNAAKGDLICVLHADTKLPKDAVTIIEHTMADKRISLASFLPRIAGDNGTHWGTSFHNWIKTWYTPLLFRPHLFIRGLRLLFGDHAMFFRRNDFLNVGGMDERVSIMEEADLCIAMARIGRIKMVRRWVWTSDRRIAKWGAIKANLIYFKVGIMWAFGARERLSKHYPDIR